MTEQIQCPLCGHKFNEEDALGACDACPLSKKSCGNIKCPNCGYDFPLIKETKFEKWIKSKFAK
jgi:uncharacterized Zn finger protein (UPF0148 family)